MTDEPNVHYKGIHMDRPDVSVIEIIRDVSDDCADAYALLRRYLDDDRAPDTVMRLMHAPDVESREAALLGALAAMFGATPVGKIAECFGVSQPLASTLCAFLAVHTLPDPCRIVPPALRVQLDSIEVASADDARAAGLDVAAVGKPS